MFTRFLSAALIFFAFCLSALSQTETKIMVAPNIQVSRQDADLPHAETHLAVNPKDAKNLLGGSIAFTRDERGNTSKLYVSKDGGYAWTTIEFPELGGVDPQVAFGLNGTAYFYWLGSKGFFYRSLDGGSTWEKGGQAIVFDHPMLAVDLSFGRHAGRIYMSGMYGIRGLGVLRSEDDGKSFIGPVKIPNPKNKWILNQSLHILSDGTLIVPYIFWDDEGGRKADTPTTDFEIIISEDGGVTFSEPILIGKIPFKTPEKIADWKDNFAKQSNYLSFGSDPKTNQIYVVWLSEKTGKLRAYFSTSKDRGKTWTPEKPLDDQAPAWTKQYQSHLAVNKNGTIGVMWYDTRDCQRQDCYNLYFTASLDKGETFLPSKKVSSETSYPISSKNLTPFYGFGLSGKETTEQRYRTAFGRWSNGGDYLGFAADLEGQFRPFWIDSRDGVFQIFTTQIKVGKGETLPANLKEISARDKIRILSDPPEYDFAKEEASISVRLKNTSTETIYAPLKLDLKKLNGWKLIETNNKEIETATIDFSKSLGDFKSLPPNAISEPIKLKFRFDGLANAPSFNFDVSGLLVK